MAHSDPTVQNPPSNPEKSTLEGKNKFLAFWFFLGGETVLFACLFGTYLGLTRNLSYVEVGPKELFNLPMIFVATMILLVSSLTSLFGVMNMRNGNISGTMIWFGITMLLGWTFVGLEIFEFSEYVGEGLVFSSNAFASSFYTLLGFHGGHVLFGSFWVLGLLLQLPRKKMSTVMAPKFFVFSLYWHFVDVVWVFIFTVVYLMGKVG